MTTNYIASSELLNYHHPTIQALIDHKGWRTLTSEQALQAVYYFIRDEIQFGYNRDDIIPASDVLNDGYGQCNTKNTLLMALLRALNIPCKLHGFTIYNALQRGVIPDYLMLFAPKRILHSWVEVKIKGEWLNHEGFIIDKALLTQVQQAYPKRKNFNGYGIAVSNLQCPNNENTTESTYIQSDGIADDFGRFDTPDDFYNLNGSNLKGVKKWLYRIALRQLINRNVQTLRNNGLPG